MKIRNKKTGEIGCLFTNIEGYKIFNEDGIILGIYKSLAELCAEWEDYDEPKEYWYIDYDGGILCSEHDNSSAEKMMISMGNCFESLEEAEKAVEKLKAVKRLKDKGFRFGHFVTYGKDGCGKVVFKCDEIKLGYENAKEFYEDIVLLFGGEE